MQREEHEPSRASALEPRSEDHRGPLGRCGRFALHVRLDSGGMGEVFLGVKREQGVDRFAAVKRLLSQMAYDETFIGMFLDEARLAARLQHDNVCGVYEIGETEGLYYIAMEWVHGASLATLLRQPLEHGKMPVPIAARIAADIASALEYAHTLTDAGGVPLGIVHRDVSPANLMIAYDGSVKLLDFGLAKARTHAHKTARGYVKGKFGYLAPEQIGDGPLDGRTDLFALGLCLHEALSGRALFDQPNAAMTVAAIRQFVRASSVRRARPDVSEALDAVILRALSRDPRERFQTGAEMRQSIVDAVPNIATREELAAYVERLYPEAERAKELGLDAIPEPISAPPPPVPHEIRSDPAPPALPVDRKRQIALVLGLVLAVLGGLAWLAR